MYSASTLTNKLFYQKKLNTLNILPEFKTALKFFLNNIRYDFKKYEKRIFYCVPKNYIKKFVPFTKKNLNKKFLKFLKQKYQKKIQHLKKIRKKKILLIDANNKSLQEAKQKINNQHQIVIKNHPHSHLHKFSENVFVIPKEIPFEYCKSVFALKNIQIICFEKNSSLFSK